MFFKDFSSVQCIDGLLQRTVTQISRIYQAPNFVYSQEQKQQLLFTTFLRPLTTLLEYDQHEFCYRH